jgi:hypothetical protein
MNNWRTAFIKKADINLTVDFVEGGKLKVGDTVFTKEDLRDKNGKLRIQANRPYKVVDFSNKYAGCFAIQTEVGPWWFFFSTGSLLGGGQYFYVMKNESIAEPNTEKKVPEENTLDENATPEDKEYKQLSELEDLPEMIAKTIYKYDKVFKHSKDFIDYVTNKSLKNTFGNDVAKMQANRGEVRMKIVRAYNFMLVNKYLDVDDDHNIVLTQKGYDRIFK